MEDQYNIQVEDELFGEDWLQCFATEILDAKYEFTKVKDVGDKNRPHQLFFACKVLFVVLMELVIILASSE